MLHPPPGASRRRLRRHERLLVPILPRLAAPAFIVAPDPLPNPTRNGCGTGLERVRIRHGTGTERVWIRQECGNLPAVWAVYPRQSPRRTGPTTPARPRQRPAHVTETPLSARCA